MRANLHGPFADRTRWNLAENRLAQTLSNLRAAGRPILDLTVSNPTQCGFAYDEQTILHAISQEKILRYDPVPAGLLPARQAVSAYYRARGVDLPAADLVLTASTSEAYTFLFRLLCNPGDEVLIPAPGYPLFDFLADLCDVKLVRYSLHYDHGWQLDFSTLSSAASLRTRALVVVHPNNPTGHFTSPAETEALASFCTERGIALIADEVFLDFPLDGAPRKSLAGTGRALTFSLSGLSKICGLPQMKLAWIAATGPAQQKSEALARLEIIADSYLSVGTPAQLAAEALLATRYAFQSQVLARINANLRALDVQLSQQSACNRLACQGGWTVVLRVPAMQTDEELAIALLTQRGVHLHPGHFYDFSKPGHVVLSLIVPEELFAEGIRRVLQHFSLSERG